MIAGAHPGQEVPAGSVGRIVVRPGSPRRRPLRFAVALGIVLGVVGGLAVPASAHATLIATSPPAGAVLSRSPGRIVLRFDQRVEVSFGAIAVYDATEHRVDAGGATHPSGDPSSVALNLPPDLRRGGYVVTWRVVSEDSHPVHGAFTFAIGASSTGLQAETSRLIAASSGSRTVGVAYGIARFLGFVAIAIAMGGTFFAVAVWPEGSRHPRARRLIWSGYAGVVVTTVASFALQGPYAGGLVLSQAVRPAVLRAVWHTHFGRVLVARLVLLVLAAPIVGELLRPGDSRPSRWWSAGAALIGALVLGTWGAAGHAGTGSLVPVGLTFDAIHIGAASLWVGGLAVILVVVVPLGRIDGSGVSDADQPVLAALRRYSPWALGAAVAIAVTGAFSAWRQAGTWGAVTGTPYGHLLIAKSVAFAGLLLLGAMSRRTVTARIAPQPGASAPATHRRLTARLAGTVGAELAVALVILSLTSWLVAAQPAKLAYAAPFSSQVRAGPDYANVVLSPAKAGPVAIHLYILSPAGAELDVPEVDAVLGNPSAGIGGVSVPLRRVGPGHFAAYGFEVPLRGSWVLIVRVRVDSIDEYVTPPITVRIR